MAAKENRRGPSGRNSARRVADLSGVPRRSRRRRRVEKADRRARHQPHRRYHRLRHAGCRGQRGGDAQRQPDAADRRVRHLPGQGRDRHRRGPGRFDGDMIARERLIIHATGRVTGNIRYGEIQIEKGGKIAGAIEVLANEPIAEPRLPERRPVEVDRTEKSDRSDKTGKDQPAEVEARQPSSRLFWRWRLRAGRAAAAARRPPPTPGTEPSDVATLPLDPAWNRRRSPGEPALRQEMVPVNGDPTSFWASPTTRFSRFGGAGLVRRDGPAEIWQYRSPECILDVFMYDAGRDPHRAAMWTCAASRHRHGRTARLLRPHADRPARRHRLGTPARGRGIHGSAHAVPARASVSCHPGPAPGCARAGDRRCGRRPFPTWTASYPRGQRHRRDDPSPGAEPFGRWCKPPPRPCSPSAVQRVVPAPAPHSGKRFLTVWLCLVTHAIWDCSPLTGRSFWPLEVGCAGGLLLGLHHRPVLFGPAVDRRHGGVHLAQPGAGAVRFNRDAAGAHALSRASARPGISRRPGPRRTAPSGTNACSCSPRPSTSFTGRRWEWTRQATSPA